MSRFNDNNTIDGELSGASQLSSANQIPADTTLIKIESETIFAVAKTTPRDPLKIVAQLKQLIDAYPAAADEAIYSKPVGTVTEVTCGNPKCGVKYQVNKVDNDTICPACDGKKRGEVAKIKKFAEGLSIRAAESIRSIYGYTRMATTADILPDGSVRLTGVLVDYAAGNVTSDERIVSRWYKDYNGKMVEMAEDRFLNLTVKSEKAKLRRDLILDNTPGIVKALFRDACEAKLVELVSPELIEQKIIPAFLEFGINREHLDKIIGRPFKLGWKEEDRLQLRKMLSALKSGETTAKELMEGLTEKAPAETVNAANGAGSVSAADLFKPKQAVNQPDSPQEKPKTPVKEPAKDPVKDDPIEGSFQAFRKELEAAEPAKARDVYFRWFGPDSAVEFTTEHDKAAWALAEEREAAASKTETPKPAEPVMTESAAEKPPANPAQSRVELAQKVIADYLDRVGRATSRAGLTNIGKAAQIDPALNPDEAGVVAKAASDKLLKLFPSRPAAATA